MDCYANSTSQEIWRSYSEISKVRLKRHSQYIPRNDPFSYYDPIEINQDSIREAYEIIKKPLYLVVSRVLYLANKSPRDSECINHLRYGQFSEAISKWKQDDDNTSRYGHTLTLYSALVANFIELPLKYKSLISLWNSFASILSPEKIKDLLFEYGVNQEVQRMDYSHVYDSCWRYLLQDHTNVVLRKLISGYDGFAHDMQLTVEQALRNTEVNSLLSQVVNEALEDVTGKHVTPLMKRIESLASRFSEINSQSSYDQLINGFVSSVEEELKPVGNLRQSFQDRYVQFNYDLDSLAMSLRNLAIDINNKFEDYQTSGSLLEIALDNTYDEDSHQKIAADIETISTNERYALQQREIHRQYQETGPSKRRVPIGLIIWGGIILIAIISAIFREENPTRVPAEPVGYEKSELLQYQLYQEIEGKEKALGQMESQIRDKLRELGELESQFNRKKERLKSLQRLIESGDTFYLMEYERLYEQYRNQVDQYNAELTTYNTLYSTHQKELDLTNSLI